jgi:hypothetical protein
MNERSRKSKSVVKPISKTYQIKIELEGASPPIWRRVLMPGSASLGRLHAVIQIAMGWDNDHLHQFIIDKQVYSDPDFELNEFGDMPGVRNESKTLLTDVAPRAGKVLVYEYDFGDSWTHRIKIEKILKQEPSTERAVTCVDGARACPPEDCGGVWGYEDMLEALKDPKHEGHESALEWLGEDFDPEAFDLEATNKALRQV